MHLSLLAWVLMIYIASAICCWLLYKDLVIWLAFYPVLNTFAVVAFVFVYFNGKLKRRRDHRSWNKRRWESFSKKPNFPFKGQKL